MLMKIHGFSLPLLLIVISVSHAVDDCSRNLNSCVCSFEFLKNDLAQVIRFSPAEKLPRRLKTYICQQYRRLPHHLTLVQSELPFGSSPTQLGRASLDKLSRGKPSLQHSGQHSRIRPNPRPTLLDFHHLSHHRARRSPHNYHVEAEARNRDKVSQLYVNMGHEVRIPCQNGEGRYVRDKLQVLGWYHSDGRPVFAPGVSTDEFSGDLVFPAVQLSDIGIYNCSFKKMTRSKGIAESRSHQLSVVTDPISWYHVSVDYKSSLCHKSEFHDIKRSLSHWVKEYMCPICVVHDESAKCLPGEMSLELAVTAFNFANYVHPYPETCSSECEQLLEALLLRILKDSLMKLFQLPIWLPHGTSLTPLPDTPFLEQMAGCLAGFEFHAPYCIPCNPGHFSAKGESDCPPCEHGSYQPAPGASSCIPCDQGLDTRDAGALDVSECMSTAYIKAGESVEQNSALVIGVIFVAVLFVVIILGLISYLVCCKDSEIGKTLRDKCCLSNCCRRVAKSERGKAIKAKIAKNISYSRSRLKEKLRKLKRKLKNSHHGESDYTTLELSAVSTDSETDRDPEPASVQAVDRFVNRQLSPLTSPTQSNSETELEKKTPVPEPEMKQSQSMEKSRLSFNQPVREKKERAQTPMPSSLRHGSVAVQGQGHRQSAHKCSDGHDQSQQNRKDVGTETQCEHGRIDSTNALRGSNFKNNGRIHSHSSPIKLGNKKSDLFRQWELLSRAETVHRPDTRHSLEQRLKTTEAPAKNSDHHGKKSQRHRASFGRRPVPPPLPSTDWHHGF